MNKFEFQRRLEEGEELLADGRYEDAVAVFDELDLSLIDQPRRLQNIAKAYERCKRYEDAEDILLDAREFAPKSRATTFHLCTVALKAGEIREAKEYYEDFLKIAARDPQRFVLQYRIAEAEKRPDEDLIRILEAYRKEEPDDRWMFQLAGLYAAHGEKEKAIEVCNEIDLWFFNGKYVKMARELREQLGSEAPDYTEEIEELRREEAEENAQPETDIPVFVRPQEPAEEKKEAEKPAEKKKEEPVKEVRGLYSQQKNLIATVLPEREEPVEEPVEEEPVEEAAQKVPVQEEPAKEAPVQEAPAQAEQVSFRVRPAVIEEEDMMFSMDYSSAEAETVRDDLFEEFPEEEPVKKEKKPAKQEEKPAKKEEKPEEEKDEHVVFKVTNSATVAAKAAEAAGEELKAEFSRNPEKDIFHFNFDFDEEDEDDDDDSDFFGQKKETAPIIDSSDDEDNEEDDEDEKVIEQELENIDDGDDDDDAEDDEDDDSDDAEDDDDDDSDDDDDDDDDEEEEPVKRKKLFGKGKAAAPKKVSDDDDDEDDDDEEEEREPDLEMLALQAAIRRREEDSKLFGGLPVDPDVDRHIWHFMVHGKTAELSLECAREKLRELMDENPNCPTKMLKISAEKIGSANIINSLDRFLNNMVIVEGAGKLTDQQLEDFSKVLNKDDRALLIVFTDTKEELVKMFEREPALKDSFTAVFEGKRFTASDLMQDAKTYLYTEDAKLTEDGEEYLSNFITNLLAEGTGFYRTNVKSLIKDALEISEKGGFLGLFMGKVDEDGFLHVSAKHLKKAEAESEE